MRKTIGFRDGWADIRLSNNVAEKMFNNLLERAKLDCCDEIIAKSESPELRKLAQDYIDKWRMENENSTNSRT